MVKGLEVCLTCLTQKRRSFSKPFLVNILIYLGKYLPPNDNILLSLEFLLQFRGDPVALKKNILLFNNKYTIVNEEELNTELNNLIADGIYKYWANDVFEMWDILQDAGYPKLTMISRAAQTFPTSSANIEQTFSEIKLLKSNLRNQLSDKSLEALLIIRQELRFNPKFKVSDALVDLYGQIFTKKRKALRNLQEDVKNEDIQISSQKQQKTNEVSENKSDEELETIFIRLFQKDEANNEKSD